MTARTYTKTDCTGRCSFPTNPKSEMHEQMNDKHGNHLKNNQRVMLSRDKSKLVVVGVLTLTTLGWTVEVTEIIANPRQLNVTKGSEQKGSRFKASQLEVLQAIQ